MFILKKISEIVQGQIIGIQVYTNCPKLAKELFNHKDISTLDVSLGSSIISVQCLKIHTHTVLYKLYIANQKYILNFLSNKSPTKFNNADSTLLELKYISHTATPTLKYEKSIATIPI